MTFNSLAAAGAAVSGRPARQIASVIPAKVLALIAFLPLQCTKPAGTYRPDGIRFKAAADYFRAAAPACEMVSSCEPVPPETPMAPTTLPPTISGLPPREPTKPLPSVGR